MKTCSHSKQLLRNTESVQSIMLFACCFPKPNKLEMCDKSKCNDAFFGGKET